MDTKVRCTQTYNDSELLTNGKPTRIIPDKEDKNYERIVTKERADVLVKAGVCEIVEEPKKEVDTTTPVQVEEVETATINVDTEKAVKKTTPKKKVNM